MKDAVIFTIYKSADGWRWRGKRNGQITCESGEGYKRRSSCQKSLINMINALIEGRYESNPPEDVESG